MAEFDSTAFSAVDSFFVIDKQGVVSDDKKNSQQTADNPAPSRKGRRLGVGADVSAKTSTTTAVAASRRLLQVGTKKRNRNQNQNDEEEFVSHHDHDDDEEELGRTGIVSDVKLTTEKDTPEETKSKKKKKKKGKKERQQEQEQEDTTPVVKEEPTKEEDTTTKVTTTTTTTTTTNSNQQPMKSPAETETCPKNNTKRKRRKVRSRQKNIYKDNRSANEKPVHLVPGGYEYLGRPITPATRSKLVAKGGLPQTADEANTTDMDGGDEFREVWQGNNGDDKHYEADSGVPVLSSEVATAAVEKEGEAVAQEMRKKRKKSRYKNIQ